MANTRIKDLTETTGPNSDDYLVIDGATSGTRKILASQVGGNSTSYDFTSTYTPSIDGRGVYSSSYTVTPLSTEDLTIENGMKIQAYLEGSNSVFYPLISTYISISSTYFVIFLKSIYSSVQNTSTANISGTLHFIAPFEIQTVGTWM